MGKFARIAKCVGLCVGLFSIGCSHSVLEERTRSHAPSSTADVGVTLIHFRKSQVEEVLMRFPDARVRPLNSAHGLYEIFGVKPQDIQPEAGQRVLPNRFVENTWTPFSLNVRAGIQIGDWPACEKSDTPPKVQLNGPSVLGGVPSRTLVGPQKLDFTAEAAADPRVGGDVRLALLLVPPRASGLEEKWEFSAHTSLEASALGGYTVAAVAQDRNNSCSLDPIRFLITSNPPLQTEPSQPSQPPLEAELFTHLELDHAPITTRERLGRNVVIAVIDSGVSYNDSSLRTNMWINPGEIAENDLDDDGNGFKNDVSGYDFVNSDPFPFDDDGHGTHVAGLIAAKEFGLAPRAKIMALKAVSPFGGDLASIAAAILYATDHGAQILNLSLGGPALDEAVQLALDYARSKGVLVVVAAGNGEEQTGLGFNIDDIPVYPASLPDENILTVGAYDRTNTLSPYSNFGRNSVDIVAPGGLPSDPIFSLSYPNPLGRRILGLVGTSMAAPQVTGVAALVWSLHPKLRAVDVRHIVMESGTQVRDLANITASGRTLNATDALTRAEQFVPK